MKDFSSPSPMFGSNAISLPSPFLHEHRPARFQIEPGRSQHTGQCHFQILQAGSREQRCSCQGYEQNRNAPGNVCDCSHAACYHAHGTSSEALQLQDAFMGNGNSPAVLLDRVRKLEEALQVERQIRENIFARERQSWQSEMRVLREALTPFYKTEADMQRRMAGMEDKLNEAIKEQTRLNDQLRSIEDAGFSPRAHQRSLLLAGGTSADLQAKPALNGISPHNASTLDSGSEGRTSVSAEPMSPRQSLHIVAEQESPRSSGILNLVEYPRPALPRYALPPRLSPPAEPEEPRSSGFLGVDMKEMIQRRTIMNGMRPTAATATTTTGGGGYRSPSSSTTKSPSNSSGCNLTPQSLPRVSPPNVQLNSISTEPADRAYKKRKHQTDLRPLDVLANVSAASPVIS